MATSRPKVFIDEAEILLHAIRGTVLVRLHDGLRPEHLRPALDPARTLSSLASEFGDESIAIAAETLEIWLAMLAGETEAISDTRARSLLDQISELEVALIGHRSAADTDSIEVGDFIDESFRNLSQDNAVITFVEETDEFEIDAELLEVFRQEAEALLDTVQTNLQTLSSNGKDHAALWNIQKAAHTFKGAAGLAGLHKLSGLAHRIEDLLAYLSEHPTDSTEVYELLAEATNCLRSGSSQAAETDTNIENLERRLVESLKAVSSQTEQQPTEEPASPQPAGAPPGGQTQAESPAAIPQKNPIVRVSLARLDDLVNIIRDLVSSRALFEARIEELANQVQESSNNTLRLQAASGKIRKLEVPSSPVVMPSGVRSYIDQAAYELTETARDALVINSSLSEIKTRFEDVYVNQRGLIDRIQGRLMRLRNVEFGTIATRLQRAVRITCDEERKNAEVEIENGSLEVDTQIIDTLIEPLMHLLKNAVVHGIEAPEVRRMLGKSEVGKIVVHVSSDGPNILLSVADDGGGIAYETLVDKAINMGLITKSDADRMTRVQIQDLIFLPGLTTAEKLNLNAGRGVGMSIIRESVDAAGGTISFDTWPQKGTTFKIRMPLPFADSHFRDKVVERVEARPASDDCCAMVVDDSPSVRLMTSRALQNAGWQVQSAPNGIEALEMLAELDSLPDVILSDIEMPRMGGYEFLAALRDDPKFKSIPVIIISSRTGSESREQALAAGALEYFTKPYNERRLIDFLEHSIRTESVPAGA